MLFVFAVGVNSWHYFVMIQQQWSPFRMLNLMSSFVESFTEWLHPSLQSIFSRNTQHELLEATFIHFKQALKQFGTPFFKFNSFRFVLSQNCNRFTTPKELKTSLNRLIFNDNKSLHSFPLLARSTWKGTFNFSIYHEERHKMKRNQSNVIETAQLLPENWKYILSFLPGNKYSPSWVDLKTVCPIYSSCQRTALVGANFFLIISIFFHLLYLTW